VNHLPAIKRANGLIADLRSAIEHSANLNHITKDELATAKRSNAGVGASAIHRSFGSFVRLKLMTFLAARCDLTEEKIERTLSPKMQAKWMTRVTKHLERPR